MEEKKERTINVIHLEIDGKHSYYGSMIALCENNPKEVLGISYSSLRCVKLSPDNPYRNKKCIIRKGVLIKNSRELSGDQSKDGDKQNEAQSL